MSLERDAGPQASLRLRLEFSHMMRDAVGPEHGLTEADLAQVDAAGAVEAVQRLRAGGVLGWLDLPYQEELPRAVRALAEEVRARCESFVVLGIGGSALGNIALQSALNHPYYNLLPPEQRGGPRLFVLDHVDPELIGGVLDVLDLERTVFNVISKSGGTAETAAQYLVFRDALKRRLGDRYREHIIATTDPARGDLRAEAEAEGYRTLPIPPNVGGRFSVFSAVGLLSAAVCGIDIEDLLAGAAFADGFCREPDVWRNPAAMFAVLQYLSYRRGRHISVMMPYHYGLRDVADWFRQLWAESLGKRLDRRGSVVHVGPTPVKALGPTDQHSQVQLYMEGPVDKVVTFVFVERYGREVPIPRAERATPATAYLGGHTLTALVQAEGRATALALAEAGRPNAAFVLPEVSPFTVGQFLYTLGVATALSGELYDVNAFDQPGVEAGKQATRALLGDAAYAELRRRIEAAEAGRSGRWVV
ncbi:MAG TPA: glucose-6-phosphate isomerase [Dehalococcoidia bacterium]